MRTGCEPTRFGNEAKTIIHGDALAELKKLPTESVDLIFADPPYTRGVIRDVCHPRRFWLLHQHTNDVRDGACHRAARR